MKWLPVAGRLLFSVGLLAGLAWRFDAGMLGTRLAAMRPSLVLLALCLSVVQIAVLAWRWSFTARRLGVELPFRAAWREYYLSIFLNQVLPGGVLGDVTRAWRQARSQLRVREQGGPAVRAVVFERVSAQAVMTTIAVVSLLALPVTVGPAPGVMVGAGVLALAIVVSIVVWTRRESSRGSLFGRVLTEMGDAHFSPAAFAIQFGSAILVVSSYLVTYVVAARAVGVETPLLVLLPLIAPVLMSMLIPITVAGWGLREGTAAVLWGAVGLTVADGVVVSMAYGLLGLLSSLPGAVVLVFGARRSPAADLSADPDRKGHRGPA